MEVVMRLQLSFTDLPSLKADLRKANPSVRSMQRLEGAARALGYSSYSSLRHALSLGPQSVEPDDGLYVRHTGLTPVESEFPRTLSRAIARITVRKILHAETGLTKRGFDSTFPIHSDEWKMTFEELEEAFNKRRRDALDDRAMDQFELALIYLSMQKPRRTINHDFGSYQLKHRAEDLSRKLGKHTHLGNYVSNGMLIAAAYAMGFEVHRAGPRSQNARFNISSKSIRATAAHPVPTLRQQAFMMDLALGRLNSRGEPGVIEF